MYDLPTSIHIDDVEYAIRNKGDFRMVLDCFSALNDFEMSEDYRVLACLIIFYEDFNDIEDIPTYDTDLLTKLVKEMYHFFSCNQPESTNTNAPKLIDWESDSQIIISAINNVAQREIRLEPFVHWWTFMGYYMSIGESVLSTVVGIRSKIVKGEKLEKHEKQYKAENPQFFNWRAKSVEDEEIDAMLRNMWN